MDWLSFIDPESIQGILGSALSSQVTQFGVAFTLAAFIHAGRVKKEISAQGEGIRMAFNDLADALRQDLSRQSERIGKVEGDVDSIKKALKI